ncbi:MAG: T9SS type A sorting domain-containing protein [Bacteroidales bacterium]|nr:T9SS type A sorting domain-containing protein [Bacteroidales bacterium]
MMATKKVLILSLLILVWAGRVQATVYFVSPSGSDENDGLSPEHPLQSIQLAVNRSAPGDYILLRGGIYSLTQKISVPKSKSGTAQKPVRLWAYPNEHPVLDFSRQAYNSSNRGIEVGADYWHFKGLEIYAAGDNGMYFSGAHHNRVENCTFHHNRDSGLQISGGSSYNEVMNCDSYLNIDSLTNENADGFAAKLDIGPGNSFYGCRSWNNLDDGWDLYEGQYPVTLSHCWAFRNGFLGDNIAGLGDGNGFKLGGNYVPANHIVTNCISFLNGAKGFDHNHNTGSITLLNCTSWKNGQIISKPNYQLSEGTHSIKNSISFQSKSSDAFGNTLQEKNSWQGFSVSAEDFISLNDTLAFLPRYPDGVLPDIPFLRLTETSDMIDGGTDVGLPFNGMAPDLGAFETGEEWQNERVKITFQTEGNGYVFPDSGWYRKGTELSLYALAGNGWVFYEWSGDVQGSSGSKIIRVDSAMNIIARFVPDTFTYYTLNIRVDGRGQVEGIPAENSVRNGTSVSLTAIPSSGWYFSGWNGDYAGQQNPLSFDVTSAVNITAVFLPLNDSLYEAENATLFNAVKASEYPGYSGEGYAAYSNLYGAYVEFEVFTQEDALKTITVTYSSEANATMKVLVNGSVVLPSFALPSTGSFGTWKRVQITLSLKSGINSVRFILTSTTGGPHIDKISFFETASDISTPATQLLLTIYPNPAFDRVFLKIVSGKPEKIEFSVSNPAGNTLLQNSYLISGGLSVIAFPVDMLPKGIYIVRWKTGSNEGAQKLLIIR